MGNSEKMPCGTPFQCSNFKFFLQFWDPMGVNPPHTKNQVNTSNPKNAIDMSSIMLKKVKNKILGG